MGLDRERGSCIGATGPSASTWRNLGGQRRTRTLWESVLRGCENLPESE